MNHDELKESNQRMGTLLKFPNSDQSKEAIDKLGFYGIGKQRTLEQYLEFSGVDTKNHKVDMDDKCIRHWIKWDDSEIKEEILGMDQHVVDHAKHENGAGIQIPRENGINDKLENMEHLLVEEVKILNEKTGSSMMSLFWFICLVCVVLVVGLAYKQKIKKSCNEMRLKFKSDAHIV